MNWLRKTSTHKSLLLYIRPAKRNGAVLPGANRKGQPLSRKQTSGQHGQVQVSIRGQGTNFGVCSRKREKKEGNITPKISRAGK